MHNPRTTLAGRKGGTRQWRAIELGTRSAANANAGLGSIIGLLAATALVLFALFALPF